MTRQKKYPDTPVFHYYNRNPHNRLTGDCTIRAISTALDIPYNEVVMDMARLQCETGYAADSLIDRYLASKGWKKHKQPKYWNGKKMNGFAFCLVLINELEHLDSVTCDLQEEITVSDRIIANIGTNHIVAIIDGKVNDIWDSTDGCIGNYWTK